jgi:ribose transport system permease protein
MKKIFGITGLLIAICLFTGWQNPDFVSPGNLENVLRRTGLFAIISIGVAFVIITGGIDLSIGSVIALTGCILAMALDVMSPTAGVLLVLAVSAAIGLGHGLLITKLRLQSFIVTLCGLMIYRGLARYMTGDQTQGLGSDFGGLKQIASGYLFEAAFGWQLPMDLPIAFVIMVALGIVAAVFLNKTIYGRYMLALGQNEHAARFSGINTDRMTILAYVICSVMAGVAGILWALYLNLVSPSSQGEFYELYAIAAAVLGGCSLRGGQGAIFGVIIGAAIMRVLYNSINMQDISTTLEFVVIGAVILGGVILDELVKRVAAKRRARREAAEASPF